MAKDVPLAMRSLAFIAPSSMACIGGFHIPLPTPPDSSQKHSILRQHPSRTGTNGLHMSARIPSSNLETTPLPTSQYLSARGTNSYSIILHAKLASIITFHFILSLKKSDTASP